MNNRLAQVKLKWAKGSNYCRQIISEETDESLTKLEAFGMPGIFSWLSSSSSASTDKLRLRRMDCCVSARRPLPEVSAAQADTDRSRGASELGVPPRFREKDRWCFGCFGVSPLVLLELKRWTGTLSSTRFDSIHSKQTLKNLTTTLCSSLQSRWPTVSTVWAKIHGYKHRHRVAKMYIMKKLKACTTM